VVLHGTPHSPNAKWLGGQLFILSQEYYFFVTTTYHTPN